MPTEDVFDALEHLKSDGTVRAVGVSGATIDNFVRRFGHRLDVLQSAESSWSPHRYVPDITHSLFSSTPRPKGASIDEAVVKAALCNALMPKGRRAQSSCRPAAWPI